MGSYNTREDHEAVERIASFFTKAEREELERLRFEKKIREGQADADALRELALYHVPSGVREFARVHKLDTFVEQVWVQAFVAGWRERVPGQTQAEARSATEVLSEDDVRK